MAAQKQLMSGQKQQDVEAGWQDLVSPSKMAVVWIKKAHAGSVNWVDECTEEQFYYYCLLKKLKPLWQFAKCALLIVMLFEVPAKCQGPQVACAALDKMSYSWPIAILPLEASCCIYIILYCILLARMRLRAMALGAAYKFHGSRTIVAGFGLIGAIVGLFSPQLYVISFVCRPLLYLGCTKSLRVTVREVWQAVPSFLDVLVSLFLMVFLFTCIGMILFMNTAEGNLVFSNWRIAISRMWVLFTTNNSPNVFIPAYHTNRLYFFFFFFYLICMIYLLANVLLAKVYDAYKVLLKEDLQIFAEHQHTCIQNAFKALAKGHSHISVASWNEFFIEYCDPAIGGVQVEDPKDSKYNTWRANLILSVFHGIDLEKVKGINLEQFHTIMEVFLDREVFIPKRRPPTVKGSQSSLQVSLFKFYTEGFKVGGMALSWDNVIDAIILVGSSVTLWKAFGFCISHGKVALINSPSYWIIFVFSVLYTLSLTVKISALGLERFWYRRAFQNRFDFFNVYALMTVNLLYLFGLRNLAMEKAILLLSLFRILHVFRYIKPLQRLFQVVKRLLPTYVSVGRLLVVVYFVFVCLGRYWFGGMIYNTNPLLAGTGFAQSAYWTINFNDCASGLVSLFVFMILNDWPTICQGYNTAFGGWWATAFFIGFFVVCNLVVLNILMALILECLSVLSEKIEEEEKKGEQAGAGDDDVEQMASGAGERSAVFMLRKVLCADDHEQHKEGSGSDSASDGESSPRGEASKGGYGTFGGGAPKRMQSRTLDDVDPEVGGLRLQHSPKERVVAKTMDDFADLKPRSKEEETEMNAAATQLQCRFRGMMGRRAAKAPSKTLEDADTTLRPSVKPLPAIKPLPPKDRAPAKTVEDAEFVMPKTAEELQEVNMAATKLQSKFRGMLGRRSAKEKKEEAEAVTQEKATVRRRSAEAPI